MQHGAFTAGITPGGLTNDFEVKILLCYLLGELSEGIRHSLFMDVFQQTGYVNYFEFTEAISELIASGQVQQGEEKGEPLYRLTPLGRQSVAVIGKDLPRSVREKCLEQLRWRLRLERRERENAISYQRVEDGYQITIAMQDIGTNLMELSLFVPNQAQCERIRHNFLENPTKAYRQILLALGIESL